MRTWWGCFTVSVDVHRAGVPLAIVVCVYLGRVVLIGAVVAAVAHLVLVEVKLARVVEEAAVVLLGKDCGCQGATQVEWRNAKKKKKACVLPSRQEFRRCRHPCHKHLPDRLCQSLPGQSWEGWDSYPEIVTQHLWIHILFRRTKLRMSDCRSFYLLAVISGVSAAHKVMIGPAVQIRVLSADEAIPSVTSATLAFVHGVAEVTDVDAFRVLVAIVGFVLARVLGFTHLNGKKETVEPPAVFHCFYLSILGLWSNLAQNTRHMKSSLMRHTPQYPPTVVALLRPRKPAAARGWTWVLDAIPWAHRAESDSREQARRQILSPQINHENQGIVLKPVAPEATQN